MPSLTPHLDSAGPTNSTTWSQCWSQSCTPILSHSPTTGVICTQSHGSHSLWSNWPSRNDALLYMIWSENNHISTGWRMYTLQLKLRQEAGHWWHGAFLWRCYIEAIYLIDNKRFFLMYRSIWEHLQILKRYYSMLSETSKSLLLKLNN